MSKLKISIDKEFDTVSFGSDSFYVEYPLDQNFHTSEFGGKISFYYKGKIVDYLSSSIVNIEVDEVSLDKSNYMTYLSNIFK